MGAKNIALLVLALAATQSYCGVVSPAKNTKDVPHVGDLIDDARALLETLNGTVASSLDLYLPELHLLVIELHAVANADIMTSRVEVLNQYDEIMINVNEFRNQAEDAGYDLEKVERCIARLQVEIDLLSETVNAEVAECINLGVIEGVAMLNSSIEQIKTVNTDIARLDLRLQQCELMPEDESMDCIAETIELISLAMIDMPATIKEDTERTKLVVKAVESTFGECWNDRANVIPPLGVQILADIEACSKAPGKP